MNNNATQIEEKERLSSSAVKFVIAEYPIKYWQPQRHFTFYCRNVETVQGSAFIIAPWNSVGILTRVLIPDK